MRRDEARREESRGEDIRITLARVWVEDKSFDVNVQGLKAHNSIQKVSTTFAAAHRVKLQYPPLTSRLLHTFGMFSIVFQEFISLLIES